MKMKMLAGLLAAALAATVASPGITLAGDSVPQFSHITLSIDNSAWTLSRDTNGLVTIVKTAHTLQGDQNVFLSNFVDTSLHGVWPAHVHDVNTIYVQTTVTGAPLAASTAYVAAGNNAQLTYFGQIQSRGVLQHLLSLSQGAIRYQGCYAVGASFARDQSPYVTAAAAAASWGVLLGTGTNDNKGNQTTANTIQNIKNRITEVTSAGKKCFWFNILPLGTGYSGYSTYNNQAATINAAIAAWVDNVNSFCIDAWSIAYNSATNAAYSYSLSTDQIHPTPSTAYAMAVKLWLVMGPMVTPARLLPTASGGSLGVPYATKLRERAVWTTPTSPGAFVGGGSAMTGVGLFADTASLQAAFPAASNSGAYALVGVSGNAALYHSDDSLWSTNNAFTGNEQVVYGSIPPGWVAGRANGTHTIVAGCVADTTGNSHGIAVMGIISATAANGIIQIWPDGNSGISLTNAANWVGGVVPPAGTKFKLVAVISWDNYNASNCDYIHLQCTSSFSVNFAGGDNTTFFQTGQAYLGDSGSQVIHSGIGVMPSYVTDAGASIPTVMIPALNCHFSAASPTPLRVKIQNFQYVAVTDGTMV